MSTAKRIKDGDLVSWVKEWHDTAALVESEAVDYLGKGQRVSAREAFLRASMYYRSAEYYGFFSTPDRRMNWSRVDIVFRKLVNYLPLLSKF